MYVNLHTRLGITIFYNSVAAAIYLEDRVIFGLGGKEICCASLVAAHPRCGASLVAAHPRCGASLVVGRPEALRTLSVPA